MIWIGLGLALLVLAIVIEGIAWRSKHRVKSEPSLPWITFRPGARMENVAMRYDPAAGGVIVTLRSDAIVEAIESYGVMFRFAPGAKNAHLESVFMTSGPATDTLVYVEAEQGIRIEDCEAS